MCPWMQIHLHHLRSEVDQLIQPQILQYITDITDTRVVKTICQIYDTMSCFFPSLLDHSSRNPLISNLDTLNMVRIQTLWVLLDTPNMVRIQTLNPLSPLSLHKRLIPQIDSQILAPTKEIPSVQSVEMLENSVHSIVLTLMERVTPHRHIGTPHVSFFFFLQV